MHKYWRSDVYISYVGRHVEAELAAERREQGGRDEYVFNGYNKMTVFYVLVPKSAYAQFIRWNQEILLRIGGRCFASHRYVRTYWIWWVPLTKLLESCLKLPVRRAIGSPHEGYNLIGTLGI
jgi:hypothetical protein